MSRLYYVLQQNQHLLPQLRICNRRCFLLPILGEKVQVCSSGQPVLFVGFRAIVLDNGHQAPRALAHGQRRIQDIHNGQLGQTGISIAIIA